MKNQKGFIKEIIILLIGLVALKYFFNIDVIGYLTDGPVGQFLNWIAGKWHSLVG